MDTKIFLVTGLTIFDQYFEGVLNNILIGNANRALITLSKQISRRL